MTDDPKNYIPRFETLAQQLKEARDVRERMRAALHEVAEEFEAGDVAALAHRGHTLTTEDVTKLLERQASIEADIRALWQRMGTGRQEEIRELIATLQARADMLLAAIPDTTLPANEPGPPERLRDHRRVG